MTTHTEHRALCPSCGRLAIREVINHLQTNSRVTPEEREQLAFDEGVEWGRFKERVESSEDVEWIRKRVLNLIDYIDIQADVAEAHLPNAAVVHSVLVQSVRDRLTEEE